MGCARTFFDPLTGESTGFVCGSGIVPCAVCAAVADHLCDYPMGRGKTCDAPLCGLHAIPVEKRRECKLRARSVEADADPDDPGEWVEFCPQHAALAGIKEEGRCQGTST